MSHNTIGHLFRVTTWGESHGPAIGCVIDGCPPGISIAPEDFVDDLARRATGRQPAGDRRRRQQSPADPANATGARHGMASGAPAGAGSTEAAEAAAGQRPRARDSESRAIPRANRCLASSAAASMP